MKELSIEEKAKRYDDLLVRLQEAKVDNDVCDERYCCVIDNIVPELKESEGERIRKTLIAVVNLYYGEGEDEEKTACLYWLEKQGEHANFRNKIQIGDKVTRNEDGVLVNLSQLNRVAKKQTEQKLYVNDNAKEMFIKALERVEEQNNKGYKLTDCDKNSWWEDFKAYTSCTIEQKPAAWSDEDEKQARQIERIVHDDGCTQKLQKQIADWFKSLKDRFTWKPSNEQMEAMQKALVDLCGKDEHNIITGLYYDLKKLKDEK